jgi:hypothetical protein
MSSVKFVDADSGRIRVPWWFPYDERVLGGFRGAAGVLYQPRLGAKAGALWRHRRGIATLARRYLR